MKSTNGVNPPLLMTVGAVRSVLSANGFSVTSALRPEGRWIELHGKPALEELPGFAISEDLAAVRLGGGLSLLVVHADAIEDLELRVRALAVLEKRGLVAGPHRTGSDGLKSYPIRCPVTRAQKQLNGAVRIFIAGELPLNGSWVGSLLDTEFADLPQLSVDDVEPLFEPLGLLGRLSYDLAEERRPAPTPTRRAWLG